MIKSSGIRIQVENNASEVMKLEKKLSKGLVLKLYESNGFYGRDGVTDDHRVYFMGDNKLLYCVQPDHAWGLELMCCTKEGEPSHAVKTRYFVFDGSALDACKLAEYKGRDAVYQFYKTISQSKKSE
ncbi:TPA: hypothetical protein JBD00_14525 [Legionella pneumophila subsp. pneumophila]|nr:hypothetical protein [Legionella pneumophila subsp. pneumophila]